MSRKNESESKSRRKNKKPVERLISVTAIHGGYTYKEVNKLLSDAGFGPMNQDSFLIEEKKYVPHIFGSNKVNQKLRDQIEHPATVGNLR